MNTVNSGVVLDFWLSEAGQRAVGQLEDISPWLAHDMKHLLCQKIREYLPYFQVSRTVTLINDLRQSTSGLKVLDFGCGNGWEALSLALLLHPASVMGIGHVPAWEDSSREGSLRATLPELLERMSHAAMYFEGHPLAARLNELKNLIEVVDRKWLCLVSHDISEATWPENTSQFHVVFSRSSFYHAKDHAQVLEKIRDRMMLNAFYALDEPTDAIDSYPGMSLEWISGMAMDRLGFSNCETLDLGAHRPIILLHR